MDRKEMEEQVIHQYKQDEQKMILIFAQWCVNNELNPFEVYRKAYPNQPANTALEDAAELTLPPSEAHQISVETLLEILSLFGNDDLAFVVNEEWSQLERKNNK
ncbi:hypothetical protein SAMN05216353_10292 [Halobacillus alkaliphilus]|uniref:Uncharacterized protein n=1 Tax=Halobacillus alkaliphilus TaxID=396056 RepID=A0A1I2JTW4_9BACI|nr:hypothetical protein [Halobacillus alkaliphilus]SFF57619.1 hypothetical protein SAMN05216353_10292 [Halobacillus alkaliphilus]